MFYTEIAAMKSGKVKRQLIALNTLKEATKSFVTAHDMYTTSELISVIIENGICSDNAGVRALSINMIRVAYRIRIVHWSEVRNAITSEIASPDDTRPLVEALLLVSELPLREKVIFITSEEVTSAIKNVSLLSNDFMRLRTCSIRIISDILLSVWYGVERGCQLEGVIRYESMIESRRAKDDLQDFIKDIFKGTYSVLTSYYIKEVFIYGYSYLECVYFFMSISWCVIVLYGIDDIWY